jgi:hypothetical protein
MRLHKEAENLDPQVERELAALEAALAGRPVDPDLAEIGALASDLRRLRPEPRPEFTADLDAEAAAGFSGGRASAGDRVGRTWERFRAAPLRRQLMPVAASGLAAVVVATAIVASGGEKLGGGSDSSVGQTAAPQPTAAAGGASEDAAPVPSVTEQAGRFDQAAPAGGEGSLAAKQATDSGDSGPFASGERHRFKETSAQLTLGTEAGQVQQVADDVFGVVGRYDGIVLSSSVQDGPEGSAGATFEILIPSPRLGDALGDLSQVAEVRSRQESSLDITAPVVTVGEHLRDARAEVEGLLKQLANADTDEERTSVERQLRFQHSRVAALRSRLSSLHRRANLSRVSLEVVTGDAATFPGATDDEWTLGDALHDAGRILAVAAGVTLIGLAVLTPIALLALLAWLIGRSWIRQSRERALGQ